MTINKLELQAFGKFRDHSVDLHDGLNVLYAPNETGKSTLAGFIRYMLYGFPKNERSSASNPITTAQRFKPWQGGEVGGSMVVTVDGRRITVVREGAKSVRLYDSVTMTEIPMTCELQVCTFCHTKERDSAICNNTDGPRQYRPSEASQTEKDKHRMRSLVSGI